MKTIKTAVSLPAETYLKAEKIRKKIGKSRSALIALALSQLIKKIEIRETEARDNAAYKRNPPTAAEIEEARLHSEEALNQYDDDWSAEFNASK